MTLYRKQGILNLQNFIMFSYSELAEVHRTDETTATPIQTDAEGAHLSEKSNNKRI